MFATLTPDQRTLLRAVAHHIAQSCEESPPFEVPGNARVYGNAWLGEPTLQMPEHLSSVVRGTSAPVAWRWQSSHGYQFTEHLDEVPAHTPCEALFLNR